MPKIKCPTCGSYKYKKIMYGFPMLGYDERDKYILGGCTVTPGNPKWSCGKCHKIFGKGLFSNGFVSTLTFRFTSFLCSDELYHIDFLLKEKTIIRVFNNSGQKVSLPSELDSNTIQNYNNVQEKKFTDDEWKKILRKLDGLYLFSLKRNMTNKHIIDGSTWSLEISAFDEDINVFGVNKYPIYWDKIISFFRSLFEY